MCEEVLVIQNLSIQDQIHPKIESEETKRKPEEATDVEDDCIRIMIAGLSTLRIKKMGQRPQRQMKQLERAFLR